MNSQNQEILGRLEGLDQFVEGVMKDWRVPGCALSIVKDGELLYSRGYGYRDPEKGLKMDADTLYRIASNTKAFTAMTAAMLVDEGKLDWDKPVRNYIPYFRLKDKYASERASVRDLLSHRTGLPAHDWSLHQFKTRKEMIENFEHLEPSYAFRSKQQYNNKMFMAAGHLVEVISGQKWESFVQERIFDELDMKKSNFSFARSRMSENYAECFYLKGDELKRYEWDAGRDPEFIPPGSPWGGINSTANELANWMIMQLNKGTFNGKRIVSEKAFTEMHWPQMIDNWDIKYEEYGESSCAMGWFVWAYRGHKLVLHGGFFGSQVMLLPRRNIGVAILPTLGGSLPEVVANNIFDRLLGLDRIDWNTRKLKERDEAKANEQPPVSDKRAGTSPSHALEDYCGEYTHPAYGKLVIKTNGTKLITADDGREHGLRHYHYDTFEVMENDEDMAFKVTFHTNAKGIVESASSPMEPAVKDIIFTRGG